MFFCKEKGNIFFPPLLFGPILLRKKTDISCNDTPGSKAWEKAFVGNVSFDHPFLVTIL